jgi:hypothetical protein
MLGMGEVDFKSFSLVLPCYRNFGSTLFLLLIVVKFHANLPPPASLDQSLLCSKSLSISWTRFSICSTSMCAYVCVCCMRECHTHKTALKHCGHVCLCPCDPVSVSVSVSLYTPVFCSFPSPRQPKSIRPG